MTRKKDLSPKRKNELLDELLQGVEDPEDLFGKEGLLKQLTKTLVERALEGELTDHLGYPKHSPVGKNTGNSRNGKIQKTLKGDLGEIPIEVPRDRGGSFDPRIIRKRQTRFDGFDNKIIAMYARGMTTRDIQDQLEEIYGVDVSATLISNVTDEVLTEVKAWQNRPLDPLYPIVYMDAIRIKTRSEGQVANKALSGYRYHDGGNQGSPGDVDFKNRRGQVLVKCAHRIKESRDAGYVHRQCRWFIGFSRCHRGGLSSYPGSTVYCTYGQTFPEVCILETAQGDGKRS